jgi:hypothetical protein
MYPYAKAHARLHLEETYNLEETQADIALMRVQARLTSHTSASANKYQVLFNLFKVRNFPMQASEDVASSVEGATIVPPPDAGKDAVIAAVLSNVYCQMAADRKTVALKALQVCVLTDSYDALSLFVVATLCGAMPQV